MSYFAESFTSIVLIIFVWFICMISVKILETCIIIIKKLFNNYSRNTRISPNYDMTTNSLDNNTENGYLKLPITFAYDRYTEKDIISGTFGGLLSAIPDRLLPNKISSGLNIIKSLF